MSFNHDPQRKPKRLNRRDDALPDFEKFKKMNMLVLGPNPSAYRNKKLNENQNLENTKNLNLKSQKIKYNYKEVGKCLREITADYIDLFLNTSERIIGDKFNRVYKDIYHFGISLKFYNDVYYQAVILNTDQNANLFFETMEIYFREKEDFFLMTIFSFDFQDMRTLLDRVEDSFRRKPDYKNRKKSEGSNSDEVNSDSMNFNSKSEGIGKGIKVVVVREIQKIDNISFNIFIKRMLDFNRDQEQYDFNIMLVFDVAYDPRGLFEKIKPNHLTNMVFNNIENVASKDIYKEILYDFIYTERSLFLPSSINTKKIVNYVNSHQISINSFRNYFKFQIIDFFLLKRWEDEEFLKYSLKINKFYSSDQNKMEEDEENYRVSNRTMDAKFEGNLKKYLTKMIGKFGAKLENVTDITNSYTNWANIVNYFFVTYSFFERLANSQKLDNFDKFNFFFEYLQFGSTKDEASNNRTNLIMDYFKDKQDIPKIVNTQIVPELEKFISSLREDPDFQKSIKEYKMSLDRSINVPLKANYENNMSKGRLKAIEAEQIKISSENSNQTKMTKEDIDEPAPYSDKDLFHIFYQWLNKLFKNHELFKSMDIIIDKPINKKSNRLYIWDKGFTNYIKFSEMTNPSLTTLTINDFSCLAKLLGKTKTTLTNNAKRRDEEDDESSVEEAIGLENIKNCMDFETLSKQFVMVFASLGTDFKLKNFYLDYLMQFGIASNDLDANKRYVIILKQFFLKLCHEFFLLGLISRKRHKTDTFMKNFYSMTSYFVKN